MRTVVHLGVAGAVLSVGESAAVAADLPEPLARKLPRWRGFNLLEMFMAPYNPGRFKESDFAQIAEFGFNFVRSPRDDRLWIQGKDGKTFRTELPPCPGLHCGQPG